MGQNGCKFRHGGQNISRRDKHAAGEHDRGRKFVLVFENDFVIEKRRQAILHGKDVGISFYALGVHRRIVKSLETSRFTEDKTEKLSKRHNDSRFRTYPISNRVWH